MKGRIGILGGAAALLLSSWCVVGVSSASWNPQLAATARSMNKRYPPDSMELLFMQDAATAFASLALVEAGR